MMTKLFSIVLVTALSILAIMLIKYKFVYKVSISGEDVGYVTNKNYFEKLITEKLADKNSSDKVAYVDFEAEPTYELVLLNEETKTNEAEILEKVSQSAVITYRVYSIEVDGNNSSYVNTIEEAEKAVEEIKQQYEDNLENINISVNEIYTQNVEDVEKTVEIASAVENVKVEIEAVVEEHEKEKAQTFDGVYFKVKPVSGNITSRYGATESIRSHAHSGIDICAPYGTDIVAAAKGTVTFAGNYGGYGNLIIITHENGIQSYYGHCSKLYANVGDEVEAGDLIAAVGATGFATGNHLHFEIRKDGKTINPQLYIYK